MRGNYDSTSISPVATSPSIQDEHGGDRPYFGPPRPLPRIVLLSLQKETWFDDMYKDLITNLTARANVEEALTPASLDHVLALEPKPRAILATDAYCTDKTASANVKAALKRYVRNGGTLVFMGTFSSFARPLKIKPLFASFGLPWESGDYHRTTFELNKAAANISTSGLVPSYSQKALHLKNVSRHHAVYLPSEDSRTESMVFNADPVADLTQTPAAFAPSGRGIVGYIGDVNSEPGTTKVVLAACGRSV